MKNSNAKSKTQELQTTLKKMIHFNICSQEQASNLWQKWLKVVHLDAICPKNFLASQGFKNFVAQEKTKFNPHTTTNSADKIVLTKPELTKKQFGNYQILSEIARGGMGVVYKVFQPEMKRYAALKILIDNGTLDTRQIRRFFREAKLTASLQHPNIIPIYEMNTFQGKHYFVMKHIVGGDFENFIKKNSLDTCLEILAKICCALNFAHKQNILHRDIKPSNILVDSDGEPYLADFGLAKKIDSKSMLTQTGAIVGTIYYMAPEQIESKNITHSVDIYAIGIILYLLLTKKLPFNGITTTSLYKQILTSKFIPPREIDPKISKTLEYVCLKCLHKHSSLRYASANLIARDIEKYLENKDVVIKEKSWLVITHGILRSKFFQMTTIIGMLSIILFTGFYAYQNKKQQENEKWEREYQQAYEFFSNYQLDQAEKLLIDTSSLQGNILLARIYLQKEKFVLAQEFLEKNSKSLYSPQICYLRGMAFYEDGKINDALKIINDGIKRYRFSGLHRLRSAIYSKKNQTKEALKDADFALKLETKGLLLLHKKILLLKEKQEYEKILVILENISFLYPDSEYISVEKSNIYFAQKKYQEALNEINETIKLRTSPLYLIKKSKYLRACGYFEEALLFLKNIDIKSDKYKFLKEQGKVCLALKKWRELLKLYDKIPSINYISDDYLVLAQTYLSLKKYKKSKGCLYNMFNEKEKNNKIFYLLAQNLYAEKNYKKALLFAKKALKIQGEVTISTIKFLLAQCYRELNNLKKSIALLQKLKDELKQNIAYHTYLGDCYFDAKQYRLASKEYTKGIKLHPWSDYLYQQRGISYFYTEEYEKCQNDLIHTLELNKQNHIPLEYLFKQTFKNSSLKQQGGDMRSLLILADRLYNGINVDLFEEEKQNLSALYLEQILRVKTTKMKKKNAQRFIDILCSPRNKMVISMATNALLSMAHSYELLIMIQEQIKKSPIHKKKILEKTYRILFKDYIKTQGVHIKSLVMRYYVAEDKKSLYELYHFPNNIEILQSIFLDENEHQIIRYYTSQILKELKIVAGYEILLKATKGTDIHAQLFAHVALFSMQNNSSFAKKIKSKDTFSKCIFIQNVPEEQKNILQPFLDDNDQRVKISAAQRLWQYGDKKAKQTFLDSFFHHNVLIRRFSYFHFWSFDSPVLKKMKKEIVTKHEKEMLQGMSDSDEYVNRICLWKTSYIDSNVCGLEVYKYLKSSNILVRFQALTTIGYRGDVELCAKFASNAEEPWIMKIPMLLAVRLNDENKKENWLKYIGFFKNILNDEHSNIRLLFFRELGKMFGGSGFLLKNLKDKNPYSRVGAILGLAQGHQFSCVDQIFPLLLSDPSSNVRVATAFALINIAGHAKSWDRLEKYHKIIKRQSFLIKEAGAVGYVGLTLKNNQRTRYAKKTGDTDPEKAYNWYITRLVRHFREENKQSLKNDERILKFALDLTPKDAKYNFELGILYFVKADYIVCNELIKKSISLNNNIGIFEMWHAKVLFQLENYEEALQAISKGLYIDPWNATMIELKIKILKILQKETAELEKRLELFDTP